MTNFHYTFTLLQRSSNLDLAEAERLNDEAHELDEKLQVWATMFPGAWSYRRHVLESRGPWPKVHIFSSVVYSYSKPEYGAVWSQYFAARMLINNTRHRLLEIVCRHNPLAGIAYEKQRLHCLVNLEAMAENLASTVPYCLGRFKAADNLTLVEDQSPSLHNADEGVKPYQAELMIWPLTIASSLVGTEIQQQRCFKSELAQLGRMTGTSALERAETDDWGNL